MALYTGLTPQDALAKWYKIQHTPDGQLSAEEKADKYGNMTGLAKENPQAWAVVKNGVEDPNDSDYFYAFLPETGQFERREHHGWLSHPESWLQLGFGGALGGVGAAGAIGGAAAPAATSTASTAAPMAGTGGAAVVGGIPTTTGLSGGIGVGSTAIPSGVVGGGAGLGGFGSKSLWSWLGPSLIGGGLQVAGGMMGASAAKDAAAIQAAATEKALALQKQMFDAEQAKEQERFDINRNDLAPYRALGSGATGRLGDLWGFQGAPTAQGGPAPQMAQQTSAQPLQNLTTVAQSAGLTKQPPHVGETRLINGQQGRWDGRGWEAV